MNTTKERALLQKVFRAVHDGVCPKCGHDLRLSLIVTYDGMKEGHRCGVECGFTITEQEMRRIVSQGVIQEWGEEPVAYFEKWRTLPNAQG